MFSFAHRRPGDPFDLCATMNYCRSNVDKLPGSLRINTRPQDSQQPKFTPVYNEISQDLKNAVDKNSVVKLNEILALKKKSVQYETISMSGAIHAPIFTVRAKCDGLIADGIGSSKKIAKQNAAAEFLKLIDGGDGNNVITSTTSTKEDHSQKCLEIQSELNPIGLLQEFCMTNQWELPSYVYNNSPVFDEFNIQKFFVVCSLKVFKCTGEGKTKQAAKKQAARMVFEKVRHLSLEEKAAYNHNAHLTPSKFLFNGNQFTNNTLKNDGKIISSEVVNYTERLKNKLNSSTNPTINLLKSLKNTNTIKNAVNILNRIGEEEGFTSTYTKPMAEKPTVLVQVSTIPLVVHMGTGDNLINAQEEAARGAIVYLKLLLDV